MFRALVFDLDDTLYIEKDFVMSGYHAVARHLAETKRCPFETALSIMVEAFETNGRHSVFPMLMDRFPEASLSISELIDVYRQHKPAIQLLPGYAELLHKLSRRFRMGVITDGLPAVQERKVHALGLRRFMDRIIYTWEYGSEKQKPHPLSFSLMLEYLRVEPGSALYIGDNPEKDCRGAHGVGMKFVQVQCRRARMDASAMEGEEKAEYAIETLFQLPQILQAMN
jgi:putative hydrolase of the HAD superfamily